jgi:lipopolysaccharide O-acetyltransferase
MGMDRNFLAGVENNKSRYFWIIGDDDLPRKGLIKLIVPFLQNEQPTLLYLNSEWSDESGSSKLPPLISIDPVSMRPEEYARKLNIWTTFLSAWIVDSCALQTRGIDSNKLLEGVGTTLIQLGWILPLIQESSRLSAINEPCILATSGNTGGYQLIRTFAVNYPDFVNRIFPKEPLIRRALIAPFAKDYLPSLIISSKSGHFKKMLKEPSVLPAAISRLGLYKEFWLHTFPAFLLSVKSGNNKKQFNRGLGIVGKIKAKLKTMASPVYKFIIQKAVAEVIVTLESETIRKAQQSNLAGITKLGYAGENISFPEDCDVIGHEHLFIGSDFRATRGLRLHCWKTETFEGLSSPRLEIGNRVFFNREAYVSCAKSIKIGNDTLFGSNVLITDNYHGSTKIIDICRLSSPLSCPGSIIIEDGAWVGNNVCILPGSKIGKGSIIGANSVVNSVIPAFCIAAGAPAKVIKYLTIDVHRRQQL